MTISGNNTPLNEDVFKKNVTSIESSRNGFSLSMNKYTVILIVSILSFVAGLSFWIYVNYIL